MSKQGLILSIDQGTTSTRAILFDSSGSIVSLSSKEFKQYFPSSGWVEHDGEEIWQSVISVCKDAIAQASTSSSSIAAIGITNQRETTLVWERSTGNLVHPAIVWQDRRTSDFCTQLKSDGIESDVTRRTGLLLDPYFSATKLRWILENVPDARARAENGDLLFGTIDTYLIWKFTNGERHVTDSTNACRTMLYNLEQNCWDEELLKLFSVPKIMLPEILDCSADFGNTATEFFGSSIPIFGVAGDQHAACIGNGCFESGMVKSTYGTGCFAMLNTGTTPVYSKNRLLTTLAYRLGGESIYALEGSIFMAGATVQWLRDGLKIIDDASQTGEMALRSKDQIYLVPAFTGLGAPHWDANARGAIYGLTRDTTSDDLAKASLEAVCYQTRDLLQAMRSDWSEEWGEELDLVLRVDGGMVSSDWTLQFLSDQLSCPVDRPSLLETTSLGVAWLAGERSGIWPNQSDFASLRVSDTYFSPQMSSSDRDRLYSGWQDSVRRTLTNY